MGGNPPEFANNEPDGYGATLLGAYNSRRLDEAEESASDGKTWEMVYVGIVLCFMFAALLSDRIGVSSMLQILR